MIYDSPSEEIFQSNGPPSIASVSNFCGIESIERNSIVMVNREQSLSVIEGYNAVEVQPQNKRKTRKTPKFIKILYDILREQQYSEMIFWTPDQEAFIINKEKIMDFSNQVLAKYFKHNNYGSFVRQLNMYNFVKIRLRIICQTQEYDSQNDIFKHESFKKGNFEDLANVQRKTVSKNNTKKKNNQVSINFQQNQLALISKDSQLQGIINQRGLAQLEIQEEPLFPREQSNVFPQSIFVSGNMRLSTSTQEKIQSLKEDQENLQQKCLELFRQNQMINSQISSLYRRVHMQALNKNKIIQELIKYMNLLEQKTIEQSHQLVLSNKQQYKKSRAAFEFSLQKFLTLLKNNQTNDICLEMFQQFFDKRQIETFMQKFSFLLESQLRYTNPSINKPKVIPLFYQQRQKRSPSLSFQELLNEVPSLLNLADKNDQTQRRE